MAKTILEMDEISVRRGKHTILDGVQFSVESGQNWVILGGNGSGKTSLLNVLMGYLVSTTGKVQMAGRAEAAKNPSLNWDDWRKRIGFVSNALARRIEPDETAVEIALSGRHAMLNYWLQKDDDAATFREAEETLAQVGLADKRTHSWAILSHGERQRALIARALMAKNLEMLILDEPCAGLDPVARENFLQFLEELVQQKSFQSLLLVTHHVEEIIPSITHALVLGKGRVIAQGKKEQVLHSKTLSEAFGGKVELRLQNGRYHLYFGEEIDHNRGRIV